MAHKTPKIQCICALRTYARRTQKAATWSQSGHQKQRVRSAHPGQNKPRAAGNTETAKGEKEEVNNDSAMHHTTPHTSNVSDDAHALRPRRARGTTNVFFSTTKQEWAQQTWPVLAFDTRNRMQRMHQCVRTSFRGRAQPSVIHVPSHGAAGAAHGTRSTTRRQPASKLHCTRHLKACHGCNASTPVKQ